MNGTAATAPARAQRQQVDEAILLVKEARSAYREHAARGNGEAVVEDLRDAVLRLHSMLEQWADDPEHSDDWLAYDLDTLDEVLHLEVPTGSTGSGMSTRTTGDMSEPAIATADAQLLDEWADGLIGFAKEIGFAPETEQNLVVETGTLADLEWLLSVRGQREALATLRPAPESELATKARRAVADGGVRTASPSAPIAPGETPAERLEAADVPTSPDGRIPFRGPFFREIAERKEQGKDAKITVASKNAETGVGKSTCALYLAHILDTSPDGFSVDEKGTLNVSEFLAGYDTLPAGSALILDEAEQIDSRRAMSEQNVDAAYKWQTRRVREIMGVLTLPKFDVLDSRMRDLVDYRVEVRCRGEAEIFKKAHEPFSGDIWWQPVQSFQFPNLDMTPGMQALHQLKEEHINPAGEEGDSSFVRQEEVAERVENERKAAAKEREKQIAQRMRDEGKSVREVANALDRSTSTISEWTQ